MLEKVRRIVHSVWPAPSVRVRVEKSWDPISGLFFLRLLDDDGVALDGAAGIDSLAENFVHRGKWARIMHPTKRVRRQRSRSGAKSTSSRCSRHSRAGPLAGARAKSSRITETSH
jgi:hypothetical protein